MLTATRGPGTVFAIAASSWVNPALSLLTCIVVSGFPVASAISTSWLSRWVSIPVTASTVSVSMVMRPLSPSRVWGPTSAPAWVESPGGISVTGHASGRTGF
jgi:hypothetical protein